MTDQKQSKSTSFMTEVPKKKKNETPEERKIRKEAERSLRHANDRRKTDTANLTPIIASVEKKTRVDTVQSDKESRKKTDKKKSEVVKIEEVKEIFEENETPLSFGLNVPTSKRKTYTRDELEMYFDQYIKALETELEQSRDNKNRKVNVKTWRLLLNEIRRLKTVSLRVMKKPKRRSENAQSGFMKPVQISKEMADFAGWNHLDLKSRVDVTKYICDYIKENNLQNPSDRRQIIADDRLSKLLKHNSSDVPLTYYLLQKKIQPHFVM